MVEFALVAPVVFLLVFGMMDAGRVYFQYVTLTNAVREAARYETVTWSAAGPATLSSLAAAPANTVQGKIQSFGKYAGLAFVNDATHMVVTFYDTTVTPPVQCAHWDFATGTVVLEPGYTNEHPRTADLVKVRAVYDFKTIVPIVSQLTGAVLSLATEAAVRLE
jgi:Flp pilus assembly protein TadG